MGHQKVVDVLQPLCYDYQLTIVHTVISHEAICLLEFLKIFAKSSLLLTGMIKCHRSTFGLKVEKVFSYL